MPATLLKAPPAALPQPSDLPPLFRLHPVACNASLISMSVGERAKKSISRTSREVGKRKESPLHEDLSRSCGLLEEPEPHDGAGGAWGAREEPSEGVEACVSTKRKRAGDAERAYACSHDGCGKRFTSSSNLHGVSILN